MESRTRYPSREVAHRRLTTAASIGCVVMLAGALSFSLRGEFESTAMAMSPDKPVEPAFVGPIVIEPSAQELHREHLQAIQEHQAEQLRKERELAEKKRKQARAAAAAAADPLQQQLNAITPDVYSTLVYVGDECEGRDPDQWNEDNGTFGGGLNIQDDVWLDFEGTDFADTSHNATQKEQMVIMMRVQAHFGWGLPTWCPLARPAPWEDRFSVFKGY